MIKIILLILLIVVAVNVMVAKTVDQNTAPVAIINPVNVVETASPPDSLTSSNSNVVAATSQFSQIKSGESSTLVAFDELTVKSAVVPVSPGEVTVPKLPLSGKLS